MSFDELRALVLLWGPIIGGLGAFALPFLYTIMKDARTRRIEAQKPHLERQMKLYTEACQVAVCLATSANTEHLAAAEKRFWELYWGELCMVEDRGVEKAMMILGQALKAKAEQTELQRASYTLAHALRHSLEGSWGFRVLPY